MIGKSFENLRDFFFKKKIPQNARYLHERLEVSLLEVCVEDRTDLDVTKGSELSTFHFDHPANGILNTENCSTHFAAAIRRETNHILFIFLRQTL